MCAVKNLENWCPSWHHTKSMIKLLFIFSKNTLFLLDQPANSNIYLILIKEALLLHIVFGETHCVEECNTQPTAV